ncbi:hypothetical protein Mlab_0703 [Methanocorpusculum labreanum Z]|uniref:Archaeal Type IV pilin N-terminal domain-containing protein n=1 Tax=Methanocorpusculum labreanum (strain ATCC 43576 / DSM 4855 / Z) TaxID=410358 RepID=A2SRB9_METLZ|nr:hypothetical protein [Methanocorpusculum labreanum]ABN06875.1 hypothetical protein Mlab_0703 [Methanocorpusculum labreanum Z]
MALKYKKQSQKEKRLVMASVLAIVSIIIVAACASVALLGTGYVIDKSLEDPDVLLHVFVVGNDVIVTIYEGRRVDELTMVSLEIEGVSLPQSVSLKPAPNSGTGEIYFTEACAGVTGVRDIAVRGVFSDGKTQLLKLTTIKFT